ncbi:hypothetical protein C461_03247 [Halorubrum aidingense JCM 13560]|uniref:Uncharacterized protein n=1 Tax=Halorubrum aidingense JCM 13560 TaxID=1230454 RepID=M0PGX9_9EURY|nr:hypothetical protein [Halorubrum aidingense]EMA69158.1 hypothetical protein C461_03247 [Halorubrum aidingense JCM 13560]
MIEEGTRQFDLYDLVSVLIPGSTFTVGLVPLLPADTGSLSTAALVVVLLLGFVFGRGIHALGIQVESHESATSHREVFRQEIANTSAMSEDVVDRFYTTARQKFDLDFLSTDRTQLDPIKDSTEIDTLYDHVRSYIHMDARGRSRTFQAVLDFCRGMMIASGILSFIYLTYAIALVTGFTESSWAPYVSYLGNYELRPALIAFGALFILAGAFITFEQIRSDYRTYYIEYLMTDYLVLERDS